MDGLECSVIYQKHPDLLQDSTLASLAGVKTPVKVPVANPVVVKNSAIVVEPVPAPAAAAPVVAPVDPAKSAAAPAEAKTIKLDVHNIPFYMCVLKNKKVELTSKATLTDEEKNQVHQIDTTINSLQGLLNKLKNENKRKTD